MAINQTFTDTASGSTSQAAPADASSDVAIGGEFTGEVKLLAHVPNITDPFVLEIATFPRIFDVNTSDASITYSFEATDIIGSVTVHFGP